MFTTFSLWKMPLQTQWEVMLKGSQQLGTKSSDFFTQPACLTYAHSLVVSPSGLCVEARAGRMVGTAEAETVCGLSSHLIWDV